MFAAIDNRPQGCGQLVVVAHHGEGSMSAGCPCSKQHLGDRLRGNFGMIRGIRKQGRRLVAHQIGCIRRQENRYGAIR
jgi:hypothetical protein